AGGRAGVAGNEGQVRHRDQVQLAVEDPEDVVAIEIEVVHVAPDLLVVRRVTEAQVAVVRLQGQLVSGDAPAVPGAEGADRDDARGAGGMLFVHGANVRVSTDK